MTIKRIEVGPRMSQAVVHNGTVYLAGQVGRGATVSEQTSDMLDSIDRWLKEAGSDKSRILSVTIWLANISDFSEMNVVWDAWVDAENTPARACVEGRLATPKFLVEAMVTAAV